ncbi:hypothetical protein [Streptomyces sp. NPDC001436]
MSAPKGTAELRDDLFALTKRIDSHPHWRTTGLNREDKTRLTAAQEGPGVVREVSVWWVGGELVVTERG